MPKLRELITKTRAALGRADEPFLKRIDWVVIAVLVAGFVIRYRLTTLTFFELDEGYHARLSLPGFPDLWRTAHEPTHPPLLIFILHFVRKLGHSEMVFRIVPVIAGTLYPWFMYRWLKLTWTATAGFVAAFILTFSPFLIELGSVVRAYTLALMFSAIALYCLERALREDSKWWMRGFAVSLLAGLASEFATAFFAAALAIYALIRFRTGRTSPPLIVIWGITHALAAAMYVHFLVDQVIPYRAKYQYLVGNEQSYFAGMFPVKGTNPLAFLGKGTLAQFKLTFFPRTIEVQALVLFLACLVVLWWCRSRLGRANTIALALFLTVPFLLACAAAYTGTYPYGVSRQTIFLSMFVATGVAISFDRLFDRRALFVIPACFLALFIWWGRVWYNPATVVPKQDCATYHQMLDYIHRTVPRGSLILTEGETLMVLLHYLGGDEWPPSFDRGFTVVGGYQFAGPISNWSSLDEVAPALERLRKERGLENGEVVWVIDAARVCEFCRELDEGRRLPPGIKAKQFGDVAVVFPLPVGTKWPAPASTPSRE